LYTVVREHPYRRAAAVTDSCCAISTILSRSTTLASCLNDAIPFPPPVISSILFTFGVTKSSSLESYGTGAAEQENGCRGRSISM